jgi:chemotaxis protein methyltransferase WspC
MTEAPSILQEIEARLNRVIGLDVHSLGSSLIALAVRTRMKKRGIVPLADYAALLGESGAEWQELVEEIVVPETWFFRDRQPFLALADWALQEWLPANPYDALRILSSPCSTGEEPYSIAMALLDAGLAPERFSVEAIDISDVALKKARRGVYNRNSFRGQVHDYRDKYFTKTPEGWKIDESVKTQVRFRQINVFDPGFARKESLFDVIFCRNMMIYFDDPSRSRLMEQLGQMLSPEGRLFLGHAEGGIARGFGFEPLPLSLAFAFRKTRVSPAEPQAAKSPRKPFPAVPAKPLRPIRIAPAATPPTPRAKAKPPGKEPATVELSPVTLDAFLAQARQLADTGCLDAARAQCEAALKTHGPSANAYCLLGVLCDAAGKPAEAEGFYRKTVYLEPDHYEALSHLALLADQNGNSQAARQLQQRAKRSQSKSAYAS